MWTFAYVRGIGCLTFPYMSDRNRTKKYSIVDLFLSFTLDNARTFIGALFKCASSPYGVHQRPTPYALMDMCVGASVPHEMVYHKLTMKFSALWWLCRAERGRTSGMDMKKHKAILYATSNNIDDEKEIALIYLLHEIHKQSDNARIIIMFIFLVH